MYYCIHGRTISYEQIENRALRIHIVIQKHTIRIYPASIGYECNSVYVVCILTFYFITRLVYIVQNAVILYVLVCCRTVCSRWSVPG